MADMFRAGNPGWSDVKNFIDERIDEMHNQMEFATEWAQLILLQGQIKALRELRLVGDTAPSDE